MAASGAGSPGLRYDPLGRLYEVSGASGTTRFLYDGDALVAEYVGTALTARYVHASNAGADDPLVWYGGGTTRWLHSDHQGSIVAVTNGSGGAPSINAYDEWGIPNVTNQGRFQYTGQAWIPELGMYHYKARIYSPTLGRFLQVDPIGYEGGINLYAYVGNDPVNLTDPTGTQIQYEELQALRDHGGTTEQNETAFVVSVLAPVVAIGALVAAPEVATALFRGYLAHAPAATRIAAGLAEGLAPGSGYATLAASSASALMMAKQLTLTSQVAALGAGRGTVIAGAGATSGRQIDVINRLVAQHGGRARDWQKVVAPTSRAFSDRTRISVHAYRNRATGEVVGHRVVQTLARCAPAIGSRLCG